MLAIDFVSLMITAMMNREISVSSRAWLTMPGYGLWNCKTTNSGYKHPYNSKV